MLFNESKRPSVTMELPSKFLLSLRKVSLKLFLCEKKMHCRNSRWLYSSMQMKLYLDAVTMIIWFEGSKIIKGSGHYW